MSPLDEDFRRSIEATFEAWRDGFAEALRRGQAEGSVRSDVDARQVATFIVAAAEGSYGLAKNAQSSSMVRENLEILSLFLDSLRPLGRSS
jgi:hypothetical protein